ncbi:MAG: hypothetical protein J7518_19565 [Nocardioidaceae bacterium]|nr:hypothetical protein [Nocardioidaceae bacterium]
MDNTTRRGARLLSIAAVTGTALALTGATPAQAGSSVGALVAGRTLYVVGTNAGDTVSLSPDPEAGVLRVDSGPGGTVRAFRTSGFDRVVVSLLGGDDTFAVSSAAVPFPGQLSVSGGRGADQIQGGSGNDVLTGNAGDDRLLGGNGVDTLVGNDGDDIVNGQRGDDLELLGAGDDVAAWLPGEGSDDVAGASGTDRLDFTGANGPEQFALFGTPGQAVLTRVQGQIRMETTSVEQVALQPLGGGDEITVDGTNRAERVAVSAERGDVLVDGPLVALRIAGAEAADRLLVRTFGGDDEVRVSDAAAALLGIGVELGSGQS